MPLGEKFRLCLGHPAKEIHYFEHNQQKYIVEFEFEKFLLWTESDLEIIFIHSYTWSHTPSFLIPFFNFTKLDNNEGRLLLSWAFNGGVANNVWILSSKIFSYAVCSRTSRLSLRGNSIEFSTSIITWKNKVVKTSAKQIEMQRKLSSDKCATY